MQITSVGTVHWHRGIPTVREGGVVVTKARAKVGISKVLTCAVFGVASREHDLLALCHVVQPGRSRSMANNLPTQFADDAVEVMAQMIRDKGANFNSGLGQSFLVGSNDLAVAHYMVKGIFPRFGLSTSGLIYDIGSSSFEREIWFSRGNLYVRRDGSVDLDITRLV